MILYVILLVIYLVLVVSFVYLFLKNEKNLNKTLNYIKQRFFKCCIKNSLDGFSETEKEEIRENYKNSDESCKIKRDAAANAPFDLCIYPNDTPEIIATKNKVLKALRDMDNVVIEDGGNVKYIMPFEALAFLNYNLPPLVSEDGEIVIKKTDDNKNIEIISNQELISYLEQLILFDEDGKQSSVEDLLSDENIKESLLKIHNIKQRLEKLNLITDDNIDKQLKIEGLEKELKGVTDTLTKQVNKRRKKSKEKTKLSRKKRREQKENSRNNKDSNHSQADINNKDVGVIEEKISDDNEFGLLELDLSDIKKDLEQDKKKEYTKVDLSSTEDDMEDLLPHLLDNEIEKSEIKNNNFETIDRELFYKKTLFYKNVPNMREIDFVDLSNFESDLKYILTNYWCEIIHNIAKSNKLIYSENKQNILIPFYSLAFGISKLYGAGWIEVANKFDELNIKASKRDEKYMNIAKTLIKIFNDFLEKYIVKDDLMVFNIEDTKNIGEFYYVNGRLCRMDIFKECLDVNDINIFRSFPYSPNLKMIKNIDDDNKKIPLIQKVKDLEIT